MGNSHTSLKLFFLTSWHASCRMSNSYVQEKAALNVNPITTSWLVHQLSNCHDWCKFSQLAVCGGRSPKHVRLSFPDNNFLSQQMPLSYGVMEGYPLPQISAAVVWVHILFVVRSILMFTAAGNYIVCLRINRPDIVFLFLLRSSQHSNHYDFWSVRFASPKIRVLKRSLNWSSLLRYDNIFWKKIWYRGRTTIMNFKYKDLLRATPQVKRNINRRKPRLLYLFGCVLRASDIPKTTGTASILHQRAIL